MKDLFVGIFDFKFDRNLLDESSLDVVEDFLEDYLK